MKIHKNIFLTAVVICASQGLVAQYCTSVGPTSTIDSNVESALIIGENSTFISFTGCPGVVGLDDQTLTSSLDLFANNSYNIDVTFGTCGNNFTGSGEAWIDFNGNNVFDPTESIGTWSGIPPAATQNFIFSVPSNCFNGSVRLRIVHQEGGALPLNPCATYSWGSTIDFTVNLSGGIGSYCTAVGPSQIADSNLQQLDISGEGGTAINFVGCPGVVGLDDQTSNHSVNLSPGNSYNLSALFGTCGGNYAGVGQIWIDFDQNGSFDLGDAIGTWQGTPPTAMSNFNFTVPLATPLGTTRMRVVQFEGGSFPLDPCASFTWGSTTDFEVVFGTPMDCSGYVGDSIQDPRIVASLPFAETHDNSVCYTNNVPVYNSPDVFYRLVTADYGVDFLNVSLCGSSFDTYLQIHDKDGNVLFANDDYSPCAPQSELTFPTSGYDTLYVVVQGWSALQGQYEIAINDASLVGLNEILNEITLFPNPSTGHVQLKGLNGQAAVRIENLEGKTVSNTIYYSGNSLNLSELNSGIYLVVITTAQGVSIQKLILNK